MRYALLGIIILVLSSCVNYREATSIDVLVPPKYQVPTSVQDISIVDNTTPSKVKANHTTHLVDLDKRYGKKKESNDKIKIDSATTTFLSNFEIEANNSPAFQSIKVIPSSKDHIFRSTPCDAIVMLDGFEYSNDLRKFHYGPHKSNMREVRMITKSTWSIHYANPTTNPHRFVVSDTLYWEGRRLDRKDCIYQSFWSNATKATQEFIPHWQAVQRLYYSNIFYTQNLAESHLKEGEWKEAAEVWMSIYNSQKRPSKTKGKMAFNMALYFETTNNIDGAIEWLSSAQTIFKKKKMEEEMKLCSIYHQILKTRKEHNIELDKRFNY